MHMDLRFAINGRTLASSVYSLLLDNGGYLQNLSETDVTA